jgi:hypothetical protein
MVVAVSRYFRGRLQGLFWQALIRFVSKGLRIKWNEVRRKRRGREGG